MQSKGVVQSTLSGALVQPILEPRAARWTEQFAEPHQIHSSDTCRVFTCLHRVDQQKYALKRSIAKIAHPTGTAADMNEVHALTALAAHPRFVKYFSCWRDDDEHLYIQLEYLAADLAQCKGRNVLTEAASMGVVQQVASGVQYLHMQGLVHRCLSSHCIFFAVSSLPPPGMLSTAPVVKIGHLRLLTHAAQATHHIDWAACTQARALAFTSYEAVHQKCELVDWVVVDVFALGMILLDLATSSQLPDVVNSDWRSIRSSAGAAAQSQPAVLQLYPTLASEADSGSRSHPYLRSWHQAIVKLKDADGLAETELFQNELQVQLDMKHRMILRRAREVIEMQQMKLLLTEHLSAQASSGKQNVNGNKCTDDTDCATLTDPYTAPAGFLSRAMAETANFFRSVVVGSTSFVQNAKTEFGSRSGLALSIVTYWELELRNRMQESKARAGVTFISGYSIKPTAAID